MCIEGKKILLPFSPWCVSLKINPPCTCVDIDFFLTCCSFYKNVFYVHKTGLLMRSHFFTNIPKVQGESSSGALCAVIQCLCVSRDGTHSMEITWAFQVSSWPCIPPPPLTSCCYLVVIMIYFLTCSFPWTCHPETWSNSQFFFYHNPRSCQLCVLNLNIIPFIVSSLLFPLPVFRGSPSLTWTTVMIS